MEKLFTFNKFFVAFCALLIVVVFAAKVVSDMSVAEDAKKIAQGIFQWDWQTMHLHSDAVITDAKVLDRSDTEAKVEVTGKQTVSEDVTPVGAGAQASPNESDCKAILTFYRTNNKWELARVEIQ